MIGRTVKSRPNPIWGVVILVCAGLGVAAAGPLTGTSWPPVAAVLPLAFAAALLVMGRDRPFSATFTAETMEVEDPSVSIRYDQMRNVRADGLARDPRTFSKSSCTIQVEHEGGLVRIPGRLDHPSCEVYSFLASRVPLRGGRDVHPALTEYLEREEACFEPDQIWTYTLASRRGRRGSYPRLRIFCVGLMIAGGAWTALWFAGKVETGWGIAGVIAVASGGVILLTTMLEGRHFVARGLKNSSLVIGPRGMAMVQGDIQGEIGWPEVLEVRYAPNPWALGIAYQSSGVAFILCRVKGADIRILDIYDRPLYVIHGRIMACSTLNRNQGNGPSSSP